jgi:hypothetical protein
MRKGAGRRGAWWSIVARMDEAHGPLALCSGRRGSGQLGLYVSHRHMASAHCRQYDCPSPPRSRTLPGEPTLSFPCLRPSLLPAVSTAVASEWTRGPSGTLLIDQRVHKRTAGHRGEEEPGMDGPCPSGFATGCQSCASHPHRLRG